MSENGGPKGLANGPRSFFLLTETGGDCQIVVEASQEAHGSAESQKKGRRGARRAAFDVVSCRVLGYAQQQQRHQHV